MSVVNWSQYRMVIENVPSEDGGGFRIFYPTLGLAVYGVGDTLDEAVEGLYHSSAAYEQFVMSTPGYGVPAPALEDLEHRKRNPVGFCDSAAINNYAYAS